MVFTDKEAIKRLEKLRVLEVEESIDVYPEDERDGRSDMQMLADEAGYILSLFEEDEHAYNDALRESRYILNRTKYGKAIPISPITLKPVYMSSDIWSSKEIVNAYNRLKRFVKRMAEDGYYSRWYY